MTTAERRYVVFRLRGEDYALPVGIVQGIVRYEPPTPVPHAPEGVSGVFSLRGSIIALIDFGRHIDGLAIEPTDETRVIVVDSQVGPVGLAVDAVTEVAAVADHDVADAPSDELAGAWAEAVSGLAGIGDRLVTLLYPEEVLPRTTFARTSVPDKEGSDA